MTNLTNDILKDYEILFFRSVDDLDRLSGIILDACLNVIGADVGSIQVLNETVLQTLAHNQLPDKILQFFRFSDDAPVTTRVIELKELIFINNFQTQSLVSKSPLLNVSALLCTPLVFDDQCIGVVNLAKTNNGNFDKLTVQLSSFFRLISRVLYQATILNQTKIKKIMSQEINAAQIAQEQLIPANIPLVPGIEFGSIYIPAKDLGGDFYDFIELPDQKVGIIVSDITGKGIQASLFIAMIRSVLRLFLPDFDNPVEAIKFINETLCKKQIVHKYIPMIYGVIDHKNKTFTYVNAGLEPSYLNKNGQIVSLDKGGPPIGAFPDAEYQEEIIPLNEGDSVLFLTDGVSDTRNEKEQGLSSKKVSTIFQESTKLSIQDQLNKITRFAIQFMGDRAQKDDITLVGLKVVSTNSELFSVSPSNTIKIRVLRGEHTAQLTKKLNTVIENDFKNSEEIDKIIDHLIKISKAIFSSSKNNQGDFIAIQSLKYPSKLILKIRFDEETLTLNDLQNMIPSLSTVFSSVNYIESKRGIDFRFELIK